VHCAATAGRTVALLLLLLLLVSLEGGLKVEFVFQGNKMQSKLGLLMLLSTWLAHCPLAVKQFLTIPTSIPYLTAQVGKLQWSSVLSAKCSVLFYNSFLPSPF
jgi:hypothetical protein